MSTLVRQAVDLLLESGGAEREMLWRRAMTAVGRFKSGRTDVSVRHDEHVAEGYGDPHGRLR